MGTFTSQIPRELAAEYGHEAVAIGDSGLYQASSGLMVDIKDQVLCAVEGTVFYPPDTLLGQTGASQYHTIVEVENETTLSAGKRLLEEGLDPVALNFASATSPGGGFLKGARAQEEYLARSSCLYECLRENPMYGFHRDNYDPFYSDYVIYSPQVPVIRGDDGCLLSEPYTMGIITSPAVYAKKVSAYRRREIAMLFQKALDENYRGAYQKVVFAIVDWSPEQKFIGPFEEAFQ